VLETHVTDKITTLIVDDEPLARRSLRLLLEKDPEVDIVGECRNGPEAVKAINTTSPDLVFLDIQMPEMDGFDVLEKVGAERIQAIVFVTAFDQYALRAFDVHALDYLLKPFDDVRFERALRQAKSRIEQHERNHLGRKVLALLEERESQRNEASRYLHRLLVKRGDRMLLVKVEDIDWIGAEGNYAKLHAGGKSYLLREKMNDLEGQLDPRAFARIHRSIIVNLERVKEMHPHFKGEYIVVLRDGTKLKLSRSRRERLHELLQVNT
jgi:two-component system, LytTR family, response regulator